MTSTRRSFLENISSRKDLIFAKRIVIKAGTSTIVTETGFPSLRRIANIAEEIFELQNNGKEVIFVSSGACGIGRNVLRRQNIMLRSAYERLHCAPLTESNAIGSNTAAAAGQASLMNLYQTIFSQLDMTLAEVLLTYHDFETEDRLANLQDALNNLISHGIIPVVNENDTVTANRNRSVEEPFTDNDSLAALVAQATNADILILLTDVPGVYDRSPSDSSAKLIRTYTTKMQVQYGIASKMGRGGMQAKIHAACRALAYGIPAVCICSGHEATTISELLNGKPVGTIFVTSPEPLIEEERMEQKHYLSAISIARKTRLGSIALQNIAPEKKVQIFSTLSKLLIDRQQDILLENQTDMQNARSSHAPLFILDGLELTSEKIHLLVEQVQDLNRENDLCGVVLQSTSLCMGELSLIKRCCPVGVLLVILDSRPDKFLLMTSFALKTGNGIIIDGGSLGRNTNKILIDIFHEAITWTLENEVPKSVITMVTDELVVSELLKLEGEIDLVIPRGPCELVQKVQQRTNIPILGHTTRTCHIYAHRDATVSMIVRVVTDARLSCPYTSNSAQVLLLHHALFESEVGMKVIDTLQKNGIIFLGGPEIVKRNIVSTPGKNLKEVEYRDSHMMIELVPSFNAACKHINDNGSHYVDCIITNDEAILKKFQDDVDSACVFHNASTRFADGYRFGLGAEVAISTKHVHARGPVGLDGLMTYKWFLSSDNPEGSIVASCQPRFHKTQSPSHTSSTSESHKSEVELLES